MRWLVPVGLVIAAVIVAAHYWLEPALYIGGAWWLMRKAAARR